MKLNTKAKQMGFWVRFCENRWAMMNIRTELTTMSEKVNFLPDTGLENGVYIRFKGLQKNMC